MILRAVALAILAFLSGLSLLCASSAAIGVAVSSGPIFLDNAKTAGNATIFAGTTLQTGDETSQVEMNDGSRVRLAANSRGKLFQNSVDLEVGSALIRGVSAIADGLTIRTTGAALVSVEGKVVDVAALEGSLRVFTATGIGLADLSPGRALNLRTEDVSAGSLSVMAGCVTNSGRAFRLTDDITGVTVPLHGGTFRAGRKFRVAGTLVPDASPPAAALRITGAIEVAGVCGRGPVATEAVSATAGAARIGTTVVLPAISASGVPGNAVAVMATTGSSPAAVAGVESEPYCAAHRIRACRSPSPTGSSSQPGQLSGGR